MAKDPILDLNTLIERPTIKVDGHLYQMLSPEEMSILDSQRFTLWGREMEELARAERQDELAVLTDKVARRILVDMPPEVYARLITPQKFAVVEVFTGLLLGRKLGLAGAIAKEILSRRTGAKSSRASSATTAATRAGGSSAPRAH